MKRWCFAVILLARLGPVVGANEIEEGKKLYEARRFAEAEAAFQARLGREPDNPAVLFHLGKIAIRRGDYAVATARLELAVALAPGESEYQHWLGNSLAWAAAAAPLRDKASLGRRCLAAYRRALELDPDNLRARFSLMNFHRHVPGLLGGGLGRARGEAEEIRRRDPVQGGYALAVLHAQEKDYAKAFAALAEVLRVNPEHYAANHLFGRVALVSGERLDEGAAALGRCLELEPTETDESPEAVDRCLRELTALRPAPEVVARMQ